jgi:xylulokinase
MEGISYSLTDCKDILAEMGVNVHDMMACGGGAKNGVQRQMMADMFGCDVNTVTATEGPALGVAILAGVGAGLYDSVESACRKMIHKDPAKECKPNPDSTKEYDKYHQIYKNLYGALKDQYKALAEL